MHVGSFHALVCFLSTRFNSLAHCLETQRISMSPPRHRPYLCCVMTVWQYRGMSSSLAVKFKLISSFGHLWTNETSDSSAMATKRLVVIGGAGGLGRGVISQFTRSSWKALSVDFVKNDESTESFVFDQAVNGGSTLAQAGKLLEHVHKTFGQVDAVVCAAGGWAGGSIKDADSLVNLAELHTKNTESAVLAAHVASHVLSPGGLLVLTGAAAALKSTPGMVSYGISKAATHHLIASSVDSLPVEATVLGVLPVTIDTPTNRKFMGDADFSTWTKPEEIADKIIEWSETAPRARPTSGHLFTVVTEKNKSTWKDVGNPFL